MCYTLIGRLLPSLLLNVAIFLLVASYRRYVLKLPLTVLRPKPPEPVPKQPDTPPQTSPVAISLRFREIPNEYDEERFRREMESSGGGAIIIGLSWTPSAIADSTYTATACFSSRPSFLDNVSTAQPQVVDTVVSLASDSKSVQVRADDHFHGITPLYWPRGSGADVDIVAVTGWNGKAFWSWKPANSPSMWLRDWLGPDLAANSCFARIFTYGYPAPVANSISDATYHDYGKQLLIYLASMRRLQCEAGQSRPLILIGHSLGGIIIKQALKIAQTSTYDAERDVFESFAGLFMFGVPNLGLDNRGFILMTEGRKNEDFARGLGIGSMYLRELDRDFSIAFQGRDVKVISVYETQDSPSVEKKGERWSRTGPLVRMVSVDSACSSGMSSEAIPAFANHSNLVKFSSRYDGSYQAIISRIMHLIQQDIPEMTKSTELNIPDHLSQSFVGRRETIQCMQESLSPHAPHCSVFVLLGTGGMGKTQIALQYIKTCPEPARRVLWVQSDSEPRMQERFRSIARTLGVSDRGDDTAVGKQVLKRLSADRRKTLLVYDSLDSTHLISLIRSQHAPEWQKSPRIKVLVTTRNRRGLQLGIRVKFATVDPLPRQDAVALLSNALLDSQAGGFEEDSTSIASICDALGGLPLGIQQASSYIRVTGTLPVQYLAQLREEPKNTLATSFEGGWLSDPRCEKTVWTVWEDSLRQIETMHPFAAKFLCLCSFLGTEVPYPLFQMAHQFYLASSTSERACPTSVQRQIGWIFEANSSSGPWTTSRLHLSAIELQNLSMAKTSTSDGGTSLVIHALVQQWARLRLPREKQQEFVSTAASLVYACAQALQSQHKAPQADSRATYLHQRHLLTHAYSCIDFAKQVLGVNIAELVPIDCSVQLAMFLIHEREYAPAQQMLQTAVRVAEERDSTVDAAAEISALRTLSLALRRQGTLTGALREQEKVLEKFRALGPQVMLGPREVLGSYLRAEGELATIYRDLGRHEEALALQSKVVDKTRLHLGGGSLETMHEMSCLAVSMKKTNAPDYNRALEIEEEVLELYEKQFPDRIERWDAMKSLAISYYYTDRSHEAIELEEKVLAAKRRLFGPDHLETASAMQNLATTYRDVCKYDEARQQYSQALKIRQAVLGDSDAKTRKTARHLSEVLSEKYKMTSNNWKHSDEVLSATIKDEPTHVVVPWPDPHGALLDGGASSAMYNYKTQADYANKAPLPVTEPQTQKMQRIDSGFSSD